VTPETLARIHAAAFPGERGWSAAEFTDLLSQPTVRLETSGAAFLLGRIVAGEAEVLTLATDPDARRQGHARRALTAFLATCAEEGVTRIFLEVAADNAAALGLYDREGFVTTGRRRGYYARPGAAAVDAILMERAL
jgi:ribosomal-protein-alanine N-acetyltransferase